MPYASQMARHSQNVSEGRIINLDNIVSYRQLINEATLLNFSLRIRCNLPLLLTILLKRSLVSHHSPLVCPVVQRREHQRADCDVQSRNGGVFYCGCVCFIVFPILLIIRLTTENVLTIHAVMKWEKTKNYWMLLEMEMYPLLRKFLVKKPDAQVRSLGKRTHSILSAGVARSVFRKQVLKCQMKY